MHDEIIKYSTEGTMSDSKFLPNRARLIEFIEDQMRSEGLVPLIDMDPQFTVDYKPETESYDFSLSVYGIYVGSEEAWLTSGVTSGKKIPKLTPKVKSKESSATAE